MGGGIAYCSLSSVEVILPRYFIFLVFNRENRCKLLEIWSLEFFEQILASGPSVTLLGLVVVVGIRASQIHQH